jgi:hypothetical protein
VGWEVTYWIHLAKDRDGWEAILNAVINHLESRNSKEYLE